MASSFSQAHRLPDNVDWSVPHRAPPPVPGAYYDDQRGHFTSPASQQVAYAITTDERGAAPKVVNAAFIRAQRPDHSHSNYNPAPLDNVQVHRMGGTTLRDPVYNPGNSYRPSVELRNEQEPNPVPVDGRKPSISGDKPGDRPSTSEGGGRRRRGSFNFFRRNSSNNQASNDPAAVYTSTAAPPPLPRTRIAQAHAAAAADPNNRHFRQPSETPSASSGRRKSSVDSRPFNAPAMLRKSSKMRAQQQAEQERLAREAAVTPRQPPHLPSLSPLPGISTFGGEEARPNASQVPNTAQPRAANFSRPVAMASAGRSPNNSSSPNYATRSGAAANSSPYAASAGSSGEYVPVDPSLESITGRGRYSYSTTSAPNNAVNSPRRVRRRKDPTPFNVLIIGAKHSGKTSFLSFLRHSLSTNPDHHSLNFSEPRTELSSSFTSQYLETEIDGERVGVTLWDSIGLEKNIVDLQLREMAAFVESKFEETFIEEQKVMRSPGVKDTHIHCVLLILDPARLDNSIAASRSLLKTSSISASVDDNLDLQVIRALWGKTTVIPVISKADTLTVNHMAFLKRAVWQSIKAAKLDPLEALELEEDVDEDDEDDNNDNNNNNGNNDEYGNKETNPQSTAHTTNAHDVIDNLADDSDTDPTALPTVSKSKKAHRRQSSISHSLSSTGGGSGSADSDTPYIPMSILSPDPFDLPPFTSDHSKSTAPLGRRFPWGVADPLDPAHCDYVRLRDSVFSEWRSELRELSSSKWYENWRTSRLKNLSTTRQRVRGGVTPVTAVPREGRSTVLPVGIPRANVGNGQGAGQAAVPRSISGNAMGGTGANERMPQVGQGGGVMRADGARV